jgi:Cdc6-like AAA superfamily ATPase
MSQQIDTKKTTELLNESFTPHMPINKADFLSGRQDIINNVSNAIRTRGLHVILWGQRGTGKTSIAQVIAENFQGKKPEEFNTFVVSCNSSDNFPQIWQNVANNILLTQGQIGFGQHSVAKAVGRLELNEPITDPEQVRLFVDSLGYPSLIIIDEFDRVKQRGKTQRLMADTIKLFSDRNDSSKLVIVGVAEDIQDLFEQHQSISRCTAQISVHTMQIEELSEIIQKGYSHANMTFETGLDTKIAELSQGYPHYTHLLGLWTGMEAISHKRNDVRLRDLDYAIPKAINNATGSLLSEYEKAVQSSQKNAMFKDVLLACAIAKKDSLGKFSMADIKEPLRKITEKNYEPGSFQSHLAKFCEKERGPIFKKTGERYNYRWHFINSQLIAFIVLMGMNDKRLKI